MKGWKEQLLEVKRALREQRSPPVEPSRRIPPKREASRPAPELPTKTARAITQLNKKPRKPPASAYKGGPRVGSPKQGIGRPTAPSPSKPVVPAPQTISGQDAKKVLPFQPQIEAGRYLALPVWSDAGRQLQHPEYRGRGAPMPVRIGIDFGTAFTKVAIRSGFDQVAIDWSEVTQNQTPTGRYVVPGFVHRSPNGQYGWWRDPSVEIAGNLKLSLIEDVETTEPPRQTLAFLALVIRYARASLYRHPDLSKKLRTRGLAWELNIGCPTRPHEEESVVARLRRVASTSWVLAGLDHLDDSTIQGAWQRTGRPACLEKEPDVVPEFVAQIAGYLKSGQPNDGLHALIDIGAGTLDVATFNLVLPRPGHDEIPTIPIFFSSVSHLGTHYLSQCRHSGLGLDMTWDDSAPISDSKTFASAHGIELSVLQNIESRFRNDVTRCIFSVVDATRTNRKGDPTAEAWNSVLPIFVTGGASSSDVYRRAIRNSELQLIRRLGQTTKFRFFELDPSGNSGPRRPVSDEHGRLTVARGLTEDAEAIARIIPHRDIHPMTWGQKERPDPPEV